MFLDEQLGLLSSVAPFSPLPYILNLAMWALGFNTFVRAQQDSRTPRVAARNHRLLFIYLERSSDDMEAGKEMHFIRMRSNKARNQVMQRNHEPAHDDSGWTANRLYNAVRLPKWITILVGWTMSVSRIHSHTQGIMSWNKDQGGRARRHIVIKAALTSLLLLACFHIYYYSAYPIFNSKTTWKQASNLLCLYYCYLLYLLENYNSLIKKVINNIK